MIGKRLIQVIAQEPAHAEPIGRMTHQEPLRADALEKHDELQLEEDDGIDGRAATACIGLLHKLADKRKIKCPLQATVEVVLRNQLFQGNIDEWSKAPLLLAHHGGGLSLSHD